MQGGREKNEEEEERGRNRGPAGGRTRNEGLSVVYLSEEGRKVSSEGKKGLCSGWRALSETQHAKSNLKGGESS